MSKKKKQLKKTINNVVTHSLERMKKLKPADRFELFMEIGEWIFNDLDIDNELMVPRLTKQIKTDPFSSHLTNKLDDVN